MDKQNYQKLVAWQNGVTLVKNVYELLKRFPKHENYALADQIRRSAVSVPANIAEGQARQHRKEFLQFLYVAKGSLAELHTFSLSRNNWVIASATDLERLETEMSRVRKPLVGLIAKFSTDC